MPDQDISVKCPECGHESPLGEAVLGSVRDDLSRELKAGLRERKKKFRAQEETLRKREDED